MIFGLILNDFTIINFQVIKLTILYGFLRNINDNKEKN